MQGRTRCPLSGIHGQHGGFHSILITDTSKALVLLTPWPLTKEEMKLYFHVFCRQYLKFSEALKTLTDCTQRVEVTHCNYMLAC